MLISSVRPPFSLYPLRFASRRPVCRIKRRIQPARPNDVVYHSLGLEVPVGKTLALVGPSGGGKSTMTKLLLRFYDPTSGTVKLDGRDIRSLNVAWYRQQVRKFGIAAGVVVG